MERRLAAVLIADVVGYGRLSQVDEEGTRARFQGDLKEVFEPKIAAYHGRLIKTMGDGLLVEFPSVVDALRCAVEVQQEKAVRSGATTADKRLDFRIGVNLGDIIVEGDDIHGDGVNIADRMQALAEPGGVAISGTAYDQVKAKLPVGYVSLGEQKVKSIAEPVRVYRVAMDPAAAGKTVGARRDLRSWRIPAAVAAVVALLLAGAGTWWQNWQTTNDPASARNVAAADTRPSLVVLPFDNLSDDKEQGYLADGITEDLTTELARIPGLFVISRNAAFTYRDKEMQPAAIAQELGVRYLLEGSIRRAGDDMRINAQLIDGSTAGHLWAERFDGAWADIFSLQDQVVDKVAAALKLRLVSGPRMAETPGATSVPAAYDLYLRAYGLDYGKQPTEAVSLLRQAVALDPDFGQAWAELAWLFWINLGVDEAEKALGTPNAEMVGKIKEYLSEAEKHPSSSYYQIMADLLLWQRKSDEAIASAERAIALDPSDYYGHEEMSLALVLNGRAADARDYLDAAFRVDPGSRPYRGVLAGLIAFSMERFEEAIALLEKVAPQELTNDSLRRQRLLLLTAAHAHLGHTGEAASARAELEAMEDAATGFRAIHDLPFKQPADIERLWNGLSKGGLPDFPLGYDRQSEERLNGEEIRSLAFGHEFRGRQIEPNEPYRRTTSLEGIASVSVGSSFSATGVSWIDGDFLCTLFETEIDTNCAAVFRNPAGTPENQNEYVWVVPRNQLEFSVVK